MYVKVATSLSLILFLIIVSLGCITPNTAHSSSSQPILSTLSFSKPPALNKIVQVTATFGVLKDYKNDLHDVTAQIILPEGIEKVDGETAWQGDIVYGATKSLRATVKTVKIGEWVIEAKGECSPNKYDKYVADAILYISVSGNRAIVSTLPPP